MLTVIVLGGCRVMLQATKAAAPFIRIYIWLWGHSLMFCFYLLTEFSAKRIPHVYRGE